MKSSGSIGRRALFWGSLVVLFGLLLWLTDESTGRVALTIVAMAAILKLGFVMLGGLARPTPEPPPAGELRSVKIMYRCSVCGTEVRMTVANDEMPDPPRHCQDEMDLVTPVED